MSEGHIQQKIGHFSSCKGGQTSSECEIAGFPWKLLTKPQFLDETDNVEYLNGLTHFQLVFEFNLRQNNRGYQKFIERKEVIDQDKGYINNDEIVINVKISVKDASGVWGPTFCNFLVDEPTSDALLLVGGSKLHVNKGVRK
ncbi:unnamed protein product [Enterobius vermicularis]|uniref:MATH domain-containing protein n=1 Tax=Enterobius vermicularis TaxID=51028 RepID=A0A0N4VN50_ENTVE|nr:unnamed protein product [Enterobius vermicularis]